MLLADLGADVIRVDRCSDVDVPATDALSAMLAGADGLGRGKRRIAVDLTNDDGRALVLGIAVTCDVLLEGFRPGVAERLGLGPDAVRECNPRLVYSRFTGWGQDGPLAHHVGHEIDYLAITGVLDGVGTTESGPIAPVGVAGDYPAGMLGVIGVLAALTERTSSGLGQVVDAAIIDGVLLTSMVQRHLRLGDGWGPRGTNVFDGGSHFYRSYRTADDRWVAFGAMEPRFHDEMLHALGIDPTGIDQFAPSTWPELATRIQAVIEGATQAEWIERLSDQDVCFAPVLSAQEASVHPHLSERNCFVDTGRHPQAAPAPRLSRTPPPFPSPTAPAGHHTVELLSSMGIPRATIGQLLDCGAVRQAAPRGAAVLSDGAE